jgi:hypothetical protein
MADYPGASTSSYFNFAIGNKGYLGTITDSNYSNPLSEFWEYDEILNLWSLKGGLGIRLSYSQFGFSFDGKGYILFVSNNYPVTKMIEYDQLTNQWTEKFDFSGIIDGISNRYRSSAAFSAINNKVYIATGHDFQTFYNDIYEYDPLSNTCKKLINMPYAGRYNAIAFQVNGKMYIGGGQKSFSDNTPLKDFWEFDPSKVKP